MAYWDYQQYSIGYGSYCEKDEYPDGITEKQADHLLRKRLQGFEEKSMHSSTKTTSGYQRTNTTRSSPLHTTTATTG